MEVGGKGNAIVSTTMILTKTFEVKPHTNPYPEHKPGLDPSIAPFPAVKKENQTPRTRGDQASKYRECQKNHAASTGGHVLDGCCEFIAGEKDGLKCAACKCHRSFHKKEVYGHRSSKQELITPAFYCSNSSYKEMQPRGVYPTGEIDRGNSSSREDMKKRVRTKFNEEQKEKMKEFSERLGWRIKKKDEEEIDKFCRMVNLKRQVFKVWMNNNKQAMKKNCNTSDMQKVIFNP